MASPIQPPPSFRIAVVGGSIGGLCTALFVHTRCRGAHAVAIDVYEQAPVYREVGAGISVGVNATRLLYETTPEVGAAFEAIAGNGDRYWFHFARYDTGEDAFDLLEGRVALGIQGEREVSGFGLARSDFLYVLLAALRAREGVKLWTDKRCVGVEEAANGIQINFADGTSAGADLVVGADGIHSVVRNTFVPSSGTSPYSGMIAYRGNVPLAALPSTWPLPSKRVLWFAPGRHFLVFPVSADKHLNIAAFVTRPAAELSPGARESWASLCDRAEVAADFDAFPDLVRRIIELMPDRPSMWLLHDCEPLEKWVWTQGRVVLLGDAAHAMVPHQGAGAGQAIEDAYILARAVADYEECIPILQEKLEGRFDWLWMEDAGLAYDKAKSELLGTRMRSEQKGPA